MGIDLAAKVAAFCRELGDRSDESLRAIAGDQAPFTRAEQALKAGRVDADMETALDSLDEMVRAVDGDGLYRGIRGYLPLPGSPADSGARWWTCPQGWCAGRGRVRSGQPPPACGATEKPLVPGPLPE